MLHRMVLYLIQLGPAGVVSDLRMNEMVVLFFSSSSFVYFNSIKDCAAHFFRYVLIFILFIIVIIAALSWDKAKIF